MKDIYQILEELGIEYQKYEHPAVYTVEEANEYFAGINTGHSKNLFIRNKKGDKHYLIIIEGLKQVDLIKLTSQLDESRLSLASPERLMKYLELLPGAVSPFGLINDENKEVNIIVDKDLLKFEKLGFHPNINTATLVIDISDLKKFLSWTNNRVVFLDM
ncbi:aminoacyl-tRNA deacylase [Candidatus Roizmanbacteria bacterium RIFCSPLOWO2_12_FULL_37_7b]|nr:MAG: aminoacyl-tRNA deacylase [Candidatus Roizmanbacteria bacterium RIFCSPLOWO2_12_FULL_37_7b]